MSSKTRICINCQQKYKWGQWHGTSHTHDVCFAVKEYQRRHTPLDAAKSDYERYVLSLPDRTNVEWQHFGDIDLNEGHAMDGLVHNISECLTVALIPGYKPVSYYGPIDTLFQEFRANFVQDKNKVIPNDQELTRWMKKCINHDHNKHWFRIQFCKIFINPEAGKFPIDQDVIDEECTP